MISFEEFRKNILDKIDDRPKKWRKGQFVFNYIDDEYGVARTIQFIHHVDCFYDDNEIDNFIKEAYNLINLNEDDTFKN